MDSPQADLISNAQVIPDKHELLITELISVETSQLGDSPFHLTGLQAKQICWRCLLIEKFSDIFHLTQVVEPIDTKLLGTTQELLHL